LSLPAFQHSGLSLSCEQQAPGYIERSDFYRQVDAEDPLLSQRKASPARGVAPQRWKRFSAHAYQNSAQSGIYGIDHPARGEIQGQGLRVFVDQAGKDHHHATPGYVPLGQTIQQGCERRRASSGSAVERLGTSMFPIAFAPKRVEEYKFKGVTYVPSMHRKHSSNGRRRRIHRWNSGGLHRQVQKVFQSESSWSISENKGEIR
jgi:hypothetical protein